VRTSSFANKCRGQIKTKPRLTNGTIPVAKQKHKKQLTLTLGIFESNDKLIRERI
jgi:hypothetical protein